MLTNKAKFIKSTKKECAPIYYLRSFKLKNIHKNNETELDIKQYMDLKIIRN